MKFTVINPDGSELNWTKIAYEEDWAFFNPKTKVLALREDGCLLIIDRGHICESPIGRFIVRVEGETNNEDFKIQNS